MQKSLLVLAVGMAIMSGACSHNKGNVRNPADRDPAGVGDVGSVGVSAITDCVKSEDAILAEKEKAIETVKKMDRMSYSIHKYEELKKPGMYSKLFIGFLTEEFNNPSAMRAQIGDVIADMVNNGRNSGGGAYLSPIGHYCNIIKPVAIEIRKLRGDPERKQTFQASVFLRDGMRGGYALRIMKYNFETEVTKVDRRDTSLTGRQAVVEYTYPLFQSEDSVDCTVDSRPHKLCAQY